MPLYTHILDFSAAPEEDLVMTMLCKERCTILEDATTQPLDFDFYALEHGHKADCPACKAEWRARVSASSHAVPA